MNNKVLVINSSVNGSEGIAGKLSQSFVDGMISRNAVVDKVFIAGMNINSCRGCTEDMCFESSGNCKIDDDMQLLLPKLLNSDIWVIATPVNDKTIHSNLRNFIDRLEPLYQPYFNLTNGTPKKKNGKIVLLACSNDSEISVFDELVDNIKSVSVLLDRDFAGAILRTQVWAMSALDYFGNVSDDVFKNLFIAGEELISEGKIKRTTLLEISSELVNKRSFITQIEHEYIQAI